MSTFNPTLSGGVNLSAPDANEAVNRENYLVRYMQIVFHVYKDMTLFQNLVKRQTLAKGAKSGIFYFTGTKEAKFLARAQEATGVAMKYNAKTIELDDIMYSDSFIADVDEHMSVMDVISENAREDGIALAKELDYQVNIMINKSATLNYPVEMPDGSTRPGGTEIVLAAAGDEDVPEKLIAAIKAVAQSFDEKNVPMEDRNLVVKPATFYTLLDAEKLLNVDYSQGNGGYAEAKLKGVVGFKLLVSNLLVDFDPSTEWVDKYTGLQAKYNHDCSNTIALGFNKDSVGIVMARSMKVEKGREFKAQGEFVMTTMFKGVDTLNPTGAARILKATV